MGGLNSLFLQWEMRTLCPGGLLEEGEEISARGWRATPSSVNRPAVPTVTSRFSGQD